MLHDKDCGWAPFPCNRPEDDRHHHSACVRSICSARGQRFDPLKWGYLSPEADLKTSSAFSACTCSRCISIPFFELAGWLRSAVDVPQWVAPQETHRPPGSKAGQGPAATSRGRGPKLIDFAQSGKGADGPNSELRFSLWDSL